MRGIQLVLLLVMSALPTKYLLCYDICNPGRLRKVHRLVRDWGVPVQYSVFELELRAGQLEQLTAELLALIREDEDKIIFYRLSPGQHPIMLGVEVQTDDLMFV